MGASVGLSGAACDLKHVQTCTQKFTIDEQFVAFGKFVQSKDNAAAGNAMCRAWNSYASCLGSGCFDAHKDKVGAADYLTQVGGTCDLSAPVKAAPAYVAPIYVLLKVLVSSTEQFENARDAMLTSIRDVLKLGTADLMFVTASITGQAAADAAADTAGITSFLQILQSSALGTSTVSSIASTQEMTVTLSAKDQSVVDSVTAWANNPAREDGVHPVRIVSTATSQSTAHSTPAPSVASSSLPGAAALYSAIVLLSLVL